MSHVATVWAWKQRVGNPMRKLVLLQIADASDKLGRSRYSVRKMAVISETCSRTVQRHINALVDIGLIEITKQGGVVRGKNMASHYRLCYEFDGSVDSLLDDDELATLGRARITLDGVTESQGGGDRESGGGVTESQGGGDRESPFPGSYPGKRLSIEGKGVCPKEKPKKKQANIPSTAAEDHIKQAYLEILPTWPKVTQVGWEQSDTRENLHKRWKDDKRCHHPEFWLTFFETVKTFEYWNTGNQGKPIEQARLSWLLTPSKFKAVITKALELDETAA